MAPHQGGIRCCKKNGGEATDKFLTYFVKVIYIRNMTRLILDTSSDYLVIVISQDNTVIASQVLYAGKKMSELLLFQLDNMLESSSININDIDEFYAGVGPGSFTGVRIGVALVLGLSSALNKKAYGISSLDVEAVVSEKDLLKTASLLKGNVFAVRNYDFTNNVFSEYYVDEICENINDYTLVNNNKSYFPNISFAVQSGRLWDFRAECTPIYLRKSEAELNLDKKSNA